MDCLNKQPHPNKPTSKNASAKNDGLNGGLNNKTTTLSGPCRAEALYTSRSRFVFGLT
jgi:hypothetical protein